MIEVILVALLSALVGLLIAGARTRRSQTALGLVLGLLPIGAMEAAFHLLLQARIRECLEQACLSAGLPLGCTRGEFGCTEWSGMSQFLFWAAGFGALVLYAIGAAMLALRESRRSIVDIPWATPEPPREGPHAAG